MNVSSMTRSTPRWFLILLALAPFLAFAVAAPPGGAAAVKTGTIELEVHGGIRVTSTGPNGLDCPGTCRITDSWLADDPPPSRRLTAHAGTGWRFDGWNSCLPVPGRPDQCDAYFEDSGFVHEVTARDVAAPEVAVGEPAEGAFIRASDLRITGNVTDNDRVAEVEMFLQGQSRGKLTAAPYSFDVSGLADGTYSTVLTAIDRSGNRGWSTTRSFTVDRTAPQVTFDGVPAWISESRATLPFQVIETNPLDVSCRVNPPGGQGVWERCDPSAGFKAFNLTEGRWTFEVNVLDRAGNTRRQGTTFDVDRTPPAIRQLEGPAPGVTVTSPTVRFRFATPDEPEGTELRCSVDGVPLEGLCREAFELTLAEGGHTVSAFAIDPAGNRSVLSVPFTITPDTDPPEPGCEDDPTLCPPEPSCETDPTLCPPEPTCEEDPTLCPPKPTCETDPSLCPAKPTCETDPTLCPADPRCKTRPRLCPRPGPDRRGPVIDLRVPKQKLRGLRKGIRVKLRCSEACSGKVVVKGRGGLRFRARFSATPGKRVKLRAKPGRSTRSALRRLNRPVRLKVKAVATDAEGNPGSASRKVRIRR